MTRAEIEAALDSGRLRIKLSNGSWTTCRRSGRTQTWKTRPSHFRIPIKFGFRGTYVITHNTDMSDFRG